MKMRSLKKAKNGSVVAEVLLTLLAVVALVTIFVAAHSFTKKGGDPYAQFAPVDPYGGIGGNGCMTVMGSFESDSGTCFWVSDGSHEIAAAAAPGYRVAVGDTVRFADVGGRSGLPKSAAGKYVVGVSE